MKEYLNAIVRIAQSIKELSLSKVFFIFALTVIIIFKDDISHIVQTKIFNKDVVVSGLGSGIVIENALKELLKETKSDRAYIFRFHNGVKYYDGTHKNKFSCDYEVVREGTSREAMNLQDIPVSLYINFVKDVIDLNMFHSDVNQIEDIALKSSLKSQGIKALGIAPYYRDGKLVAMIGVDYVKEVPDTTRWEKEPEALKKEFLEKVKFIGNLLE